MLFKNAEENAMFKPEKGFSHVVVLLVFVAIAVVGSGYLVYVHQQDSKNVTLGTASAKPASKSGALAVPASQPNTASGVASTVDSLATSLSSSESSLNSQYTANDQSSDAGVGTAATNVGGAYDANNY